MEHIIFVCICVKITKWMKRNDWYTLYTGVVTAKYLFKSSLVQVNEKESMPNIKQRLDRRDKHCIAEMTILIFQLNMRHAIMMAVVRYSDWFGA